MIWNMTTFSTRGPEQRRGKTYKLVNQIRRLFKSGLRSLQQDNHDYGYHDIGDSS